MNNDKKAKIHSLDPDGLLIETDASRQYQASVGRHSKISASVALHWASDHAAHTDIQFMDNLNVWRDYFPAAIEMQLGGKKPGDVIAHAFAADELIPDYPRKQHSVKPEQFNRQFRKHITIEPRLGRFYPQGIFRGIPDIYESSLRPCRIIELDEKSISTDFSHPLAGREIELHMRIDQAWDVGAERGGRCNDVGENICSGGPGMQARYRDVATDFFSDDPFARMDPDDDAVFYRQTRLVQHLDSRCRAQLTQLYAELLPAGGTLLDLMASWDSHLPSDLDASVVGLGMNSAELDANPVLAERVIHDLNAAASLPFDDNRFDAIICTASFEYLVAPEAVLDAIARVLKPGGRLVITFSNRWFPTKAIRLWSELHDFERMGFVSECLLRQGDFHELHTLSSRGLLRPQDDRYANELLLSDPVYAVWATRR